jgi:hypothetical protein
VFIFFLNFLFFLRETWCSFESFVLSFFFLDTSMKKLFTLASLLLLLLLLFASCQTHPSTVTLALLGDLMLGRAVHPTPSSLSYLAPYLHSADLSLANLESPLTDTLPAASTDTGYNLCAPSSSIRLLQAWGLALLSLANNHRFDCASNDLPETANLLTDASLTPIGPGPQPVNMQIKDLKLAFLAFDDISSPLDPVASAQAIRSARTAGAVVVVSVHWGAEYQTAATARQQDLARQFSEAGATLVVGTHPHVLQPAEWFSTSQGKTLVLYSLGNALFDQPGLPDTRQSVLVLVTLDSHGVLSTRAVPFEIDGTRSLITQPDAQSAQQILDRLKLPSACPACTLPRRSFREHRWRAGARWQTHVNGFARPFF